MLSKLNVIIGNRALNPKGALWVEIQGAAKSVMCQRLMLMTEFL